MPQPFFGSFVEVAASTIHNKRKMGESDSWADMKSANGLVLYCFFFLCLGFLIYFFYGIRHSAEGKRANNSFDERELKEIGYKPAGTTNRLLEVGNVAWKNWKIQLKNKKSSSATIPRLWKKNIVARCPMSNATFFQCLLFPFLLTCVKYLHYKIA